MSSYVLDTNIWIYHFKGVPDVVQFLQVTFGRENNSLLLSAITEAELLSAAVLRTDVALKLQITKLIQSADRIIEVSREIAQLAGDIRSSISSELGRKIKLPDALIASTAIFMDATLVSNNDKDFADIANLHKLKYHNPIQNQEHLHHFLTSS